MAETRFHPGVFLTALLLSAVAAAQTPQLSRADREQLQALVAATDAAAAQPETDDATLRLHVMRASDGSHYVAYSVAPPAANQLPATPVAVYVRLASARAIAPQRPERSLVREWLGGNQAAAPPVARTQGIALGEMPIMGPSNVERRPPQTASMADLTILDLERRRARERQEERERQRRLELEGRSSPPADTLPFEDFDLNTTPNGHTIQRAMTTGPGDYFLYVAWTDRAAATTTPPVVMKKRITLPSATATELSIGSIILADGIRHRAAAYAATEQAAHPYAIGLTEILPAIDATFTDAQDLSAVFQIISPQGGDNGKPDVDVLFEIVRVAGGQELPVASLTPQNYSATTLPPEFDLRVGHPLFATVSASLGSVKRGDYRLKVLANDKVGGRTATADVAFTVTATPAALLRDAPPLGQPFRRESLFNNGVLTQVLAAVRPPMPSTALQQAFDLAAAGRFAELIVDQSVAPGEEGARAVLRGLAQLSVGDGSAAVQFQRAQLLGAPIAITRYLSGAARATQGQDGDAIAAWQDALKIGAPRALVIPVLLDAYLRRNDLTRAATLVGDGDPVWSRGVAATLIGTQREAQAIAMLDRRLQNDPADADARWLLLHALFAYVVRDPAATAAKDRFMRESQAYIVAKGANAAVLTDWLAAIK